MNSSAIAPLVTLDEASHVYTHREGFHPPSVTTILGAVPPFLGRFDRVAPDLLHYKRQLGIQVHRATHYYDEGDLDMATVDPVLAPYLDAWIRFRQEKHFRPTVLETAIYHPQYGYAGTLDRIGVVDVAEGRGLVLLDIKTGDSSMAGPQTAAYAEAWTASHAGTPADAALAPLHRWTVQLHDDGRYILTVHTSRKDWRIFLAALELYIYARSRKS
jgi:hypothetical protein